MAMGGVDSYDFHALETIQCMAERRRGGETGVSAMQALRGDSVWKAMEAGDWGAAAGIRGCSKPACPAARRWPSPRPSAIAIRPRADARVGQGPGCLPLRVRRRPESDDAAHERPGRRFHVRRAAQRPGGAALDAVPSAAESQRRLFGRADVKAEEMFLTGKTPYPIERTLLTTGLVEAGVRSLGSGQKRIETPHLAIRYQAPRESTFWRS